MDAAIPIRQRMGRISEPVSVHYDVLEPAASSATIKPPLVLLHGGTQSGACYLETIDGRPGWAHVFARRGYRVYMPDWPGRGRSGDIPDEAIGGDVICSGLGALIRSIGEPVVLFSHSMSGAYGWRLLEHYGEAIDKVVAVAPGPPGNIQPAAEIIGETADEIEVQVLALRFRLGKRAPYRATRSFVESKAVGDGNRFPRRCIEAFARSMQFIPAPLIHERLNVRGRQLRIERFEHYRGKRVLVLTGTNDIDHSRAVDGAVVDWLNANGAQADFCYLGDRGIVGNGHMLMWEDNSDELANLALDWIEQG